MRNLPVLLFSISLLSVVLATKVETKAEAGTPDYYLLLTLNGNERTVSRVEVDKYGREAMEKTISDALGILNF